MKYKILKKLSDLKEFLLTAKLCDQASVHKGKIPGYVWLGIL